MTNDIKKILLDNYDDTFNDGRWHTLVLTVGRDNLVLSIDYRPMKTVRLLKIITGSLYLIGGLYLIFLLYACNFI